ncbi:cytochrome c oxidase subunit 3 [Ottowia sp.]|uniref:cytochrome c oxidase subunit 3 n=1 Tax=Ottowia sp. TaxID=1898956 RepID=UPI003A8C1E37
MSQASHSNRPAAPPVFNPGWGPLSTLPGNPVMWVLIISELLAFSGFFMLFAWERSRQPELFNLSQSQLDPIAGGINTLILLTSGLCAALALQALGTSRRRARQWLGLTMVLGVVFCAVKFMEYAGKFAAGITPETNTFFGFYYGLTAFHFAHVLFGLALLALVCWRLSEENLETVTAFWHMVDLIWVLLYPLVYLLR